MAEFVANHGTLVTVIVSAIKVLAAFSLALMAVVACMLAERKLVGYMQQRPGPNRVGPWGLLQSIADGVKIFFKEHTAPRGIETALYYLAPCIALVATFLTLCAVPFGPEIELWGYRTRLAVTDLDTGILYVLAIASLGVYGIILGGWSSNNKYSLLGALRSSAQLVSYELPMGLAVAGALMLAGTFHLGAIAERQAGGVWHWYLWRQPIGFLIFLIAGVAETNRLPFDLPEGETELTGGFHTEYSSMKFAFFFIAEYVNMIIFSVLASTLFLGGWQAPFPVLGPDSPLGDFISARLGPNGFAIWTAIDAFFWLGVKVAGFFFLYVWLRGTLPRLRYDQLMRLSWKVMIPGAFLNLALTGAIVVAADGWTQAALLAAAGFATIALADLAVTLRRRRLRYDLRVS